MSTSDAGQSSPVSPPLAGRIAALRKTLEAPELLNLSSANRALFLQRIGFRSQLDGLNEQLTQQWLDVLGPQRERNSTLDASDAVRTENERMLFAQMQSLALSYGEVQGLRAQLAEMLDEPPPTRTVAPSLQDWLTTLADQPDSATLAAFPATDRRDIHALRSELADVWLQDVRQRARARLPNDDHAFDRIRRIGTEPQRRAAQILRDKRGGLGLSHSRGWLIGIAVVLLMVVGSALLWMNARGSLTVDSSATLTAAVAPSAESTIADTPVVPVATFTPGPPLVSNILPLTLSLSQGPQTITIRGSNLARLTASDIALIPQAGTALGFEITQQSADSLGLELARRTLDRASVTVEVRIGGEVVEVLTLISGNPEYEVVGVLEQYSYTGRVNADATTTLLDAVNGGEVRGTLRNGDRVQVVDSSVEGWFQVQMLEGQSSGVTGWVERWLVLNSDVPLPPPTATPTATPTPLPTATPRPPTATLRPPTATLMPSEIPQPTATPTETPSVTVSQPTGPVFRGVIAGTTQDASQPAACVRGRVIDRNGAGIRGALGNVNNGTATREWTSVGDGNYEVCGLGSGNWSVVLFFVPDPGNRSNNILARAIDTPIPLQGNPGEIVIVNFIEQ